MSDRAMLFTPVKWRSAATKKDDPFAVYIESRVQRDGTERYAVVRLGDVLNRDGEFEWEPQPSSRTDEFIARTRFPSFDDALAAFAEHVRALPGGGEPAP